MQPYSARAPTRQAVYKTHLDIVHVHRNEASSLFSVSADRGVGAAQPAGAPAPADAQGDAGLLRARAAPFIDSPAHDHTREWANWPRSRAAGPSAWGRAASAQHAGVAGRLAGRLACMRLHRRIALGGPHARACTGALRHSVNTAMCAKLRSKPKQGGAAGAGGQPDAGAGGGARG